MSQVTVYELLKSVGAFDGESHVTLLRAMERASLAITKLPLKSVYDDFGHFREFEPVSTELALKLIGEMERQAKRDWFAEARQFIEGCK